jgi:uncharacterized protein (TIGR03086 family)
MGLGLSGSPEERIEPMENHQMATSTRQLQRAFISTRGILAEVQANQLEKPTPCTSWDVKALIHHFVGTARWGATSVGWDGDITWSDSGADFLIAYDTTIDIALAAFDADGALDRMIDLSMGLLTGADVLGIVVRDQFVHGWDLARAIGHSTDLDPELAENLLMQAKADISDDIRGTEDGHIFGPIVDAPPGACPADRLAAYLGREK